MSIPRPLESLGVAAAVLSGMVMQLVAASTSEERRTVSRQLETQINVLLEEVSAYRTGIARTSHAPKSDKEVMNT